jgi:diaminopimelate dehydrogenase
MSLRIGIVGYGNLGRGVESAVVQSQDMELVAVFTRRDPASLKIASDAPVVAYSGMADYADKIDVMINCGGSATDLPVTTPEIAKYFNVVDSFDTHAKIPLHYATVDAVAKESGKVAVISAGWDPGFFSISRIYAESALPEGSSYTFWGKGVSQGHSDAVRRIEGVKDARQYTIPVPEAMDRVRRGENPVFETREMHTRECFVVAEDGADLEKIEKEIVEMPNYFSDYDTTVHFIDEEELLNNHAGLPHGGSVIRSGSTGWNGELHNTIEYTLNLDSNPFFTGSILAATARATGRLCAEGQTGCRTLFDIPPAYLSALSGEELRATKL